jgi:hypothetical protein
VLDYGLISDGKIIVNYYGIEKITKIAISLKELDKKSVSFVSLLPGISKEKF